MTTFIPKLYNVFNEDDSTIFTTVFGLVKAIVLRLLSGNK